MGTHVLGIHVRMYVPRGERSAAVNRSRRKDFSRGHRRRDIMGKDNHRLSNRVTMGQSLRAGPAKNRIGISHIVDIDVQAGDVGRFNIRWFSRLALSDESRDRFYAVRFVRFRYGKHS